MLVVVAYAYAKQGVGPPRSTPTGRCNEPKTEVASALSSLRYGDNLSVVAISGTTTVLCESMSRLLIYCTMAKLPFAPVQRMSHRSLPRNDPADCAMIFLYFLCSMSIRTNQVSTRKSIEVRSTPPNLFFALIVRLRSEERRVGKECRIGCRSRWSPYH